MNRRQFTQRLAALAATPLVPQGIVSKAVAAPASTINGQHHLWAAFVARIHDKASPQMFKRQLSLTDEQAETVFRDLIKDKVLSAPNADGISHAMNPFKRNFSTGLASSPQSAFQAKPENTLKNKAKELLEPVEDENLEKVAEDSDTVNQDTSECPNDPDTDGISEIQHSDFTA